MAVFIIFEKKGVDLISGYIPYMEAACCSGRMHS
jgi:hypothetical protein